MEVGKDMLLFALALLVISARSQTVIQPSRRDFSAQYESAGYSLVGRANPGATHTIFIGLPLNNVDQVQALHDDRSNPASPNFQQWPHESELLALTAPDQGLVEATRNWISSLNPHASDDPLGNGAAFSITASVATIESAFQTTLNEYYHPALGSVLRKEGTHTLPSHFTGYNVAISGLSDFPETKGNQVTMKDTTEYERAVNSLNFVQRDGSVSKRSVNPRFAQRAANVERRGHHHHHKKTTTKKTTTEKPRHHHTKKTTTKSPKDTVQTYAPYSTQFVTAEVPSTQAAPVTFSGASQVNPVLFEGFAGYDFIENIVALLCSDGSPMDKSSRCTADNDDSMSPTSIETVVYDCGPIGVLGRNCYENYEKHVIQWALISEQVHFLDLEDSLFTTDTCAWDSNGHGQCIVRVPVEPNSVNQLCYSIHYGDVKSIGPICMPVIQPAITPTTPQVFKRQYNIGTGMVASPRQSNAVLEFYRHGIGMEPEDTFVYSALMGVPKPALVDIYSFSEYPPNHGSLEGSLDAQVITSLAPGANTTYLNADQLAPYWYLWATIVAGRAPDSLQPFGSAFSRRGDHIHHHQSSHTGHHFHDHHHDDDGVPVPDVLSVSWGVPENQVEFLELSEMWLMILTSRGTTVLAAAGDWGYANGGSCTSPVPVYPGSSAYVTSVGATVLSNAGIPYCAEWPDLCEERPVEVVATGCSGFHATSSGGYSLLIPSVDYMSPLQNAYQQYLTAGDYQPYDITPTAPPATNPSQRGYPDVAVLGANYPTMVNGSFVLSYGTSTSAPAMAAIVTLLNTALEPYGRRMGSMNKFLYQMAAQFPDAFNDITVGENSCGLIRDKPGVDFACDEFFYATPGWDAVSGLGSPNFEVLVKLAIEPSGTTLYGG